MGVLSEHTVACRLVYIIDIAWYGLNIYEQDYLVGIIALVVGLVTGVRKNYACSCVTVWNMW